MNGTPNLMFNGTHQIVGAGTNDQEGAQYISIINNRYVDPSPVRITVDSFDPASGNVSVTVTMFSEDFELSSRDALRLILMEDDISPKNTHVTRDLISSEIALSGAGNSSVFNESFTIEPGWDQDHLQVVAFVQLQDREIIQSASSYEPPEYKLRAMAPYSRVGIGPATGNWESDPVTIMNIGQRDSLTVRAIIDEAPDGWEIAFRDDSGALHSDQWNVDLEQEESTSLSAVIFPDSAGDIRCHLEISSPNLDPPLVIPFVYITDNVDVLLIDDDGGNDYEKYFKAAFEDLGLSYGVWDRSSGSLAAEISEHMDLLIWSVGLGFPSLDPDDREFLSGFLDQGNSLFLTGQDIGWDLNSTQSSNTDWTFYHNYLHSVFVKDDVNLYNVEGVPLDPVSDGMSLHIAGGDGADNQEYPSQIMPFDTEGIPIFYYNGESQCGGIRSEDGDSGARVVYLAFGYEAIDNAEDRTQLLDSVLSWLNRGRIPVSDSDFTDIRLQGFPPSEQ